MRFSTLAWGLRAAVAGGAAAGLAIGTGCSGVLGVQAPTAELNRVDLVQSPTGDQLAGYGCAEAFGGGVCPGATPSEQDLLFSFDLVFDLENPNLDIPIPLVELLLGIN